MAQGPRLQQGTSQRMTQVMQRAIGLLQMDNAELAGLLIEEAAENPALEVALPIETHPAPPRGWRVLGDLAGRDAFDGDTVAAQAEGLHAHVRGQIGLLFRNPQECALAEVFASVLEPSGWLGESLAEMARALRRPEAELVEVLTRLQRGIEPAGLFARSLSECLALQLEEQGALDAPMRALLDHLPELARGEAALLCEHCDVDAARLGQMVQRIRGLDPKPGARFDADPSLRRAPDLLLRRDTDGAWQVSLNHETAPEVRVAALEAPDSREAVSTARWLARTLSRRNEMILRVAGFVVAHQRAFLEAGLARLRPLTTAEVGAALGLHATTVGRIRSGLLMQAPQGVLELGTLFGRGRVARQGGAEVSGEAVEAMIGELIRAERPEAPLSDAQLATALARRGIDLSRRTLSNWRKRAGFASAAQRRCSVPASGGPGQR